MTLQSESNKLQKLEELVRANYSGDIFNEILKLLLLIKETGNERILKLDIEGKNIELETISSKYNDIMSESAFNMSNSHINDVVKNVDLNLSKVSSDFLDFYFESLIGRLDKSEKGQFFTPRHVVDLCVRLINVKNGESVYDPSCGAGGFLMHSHEYMKDSNGHSDSILYGDDIDPRVIKLAKLNSIFNNVSSIILRTENSISTQGYNNKFDIVLANPPFAGEIRDPEILEKFTITSKKKEERDILFIEKIYNSLKEGGRAAIVLPYSVFGSRHSRYVREWIFDRFRVYGIVSLGRSTFLPYTHQKANILVVTKDSKLGTKEGDSIFMAISQKSGKDQRGKLIFKGGIREDSTTDLWNDLDHDFNEIVESFSSFKLQESLQW